MVDLRGRIDGASALCPLPSLSSADVVVRPSNGGAMQLSSVAYGNANQNQESHVKQMMCRVPRSIRYRLRIALNVPPRYAYGSFPKSTVPVMLSGAHVRPLTYMRL